VRRQMTATLGEERLAIQNEGRTAPDRDQQRGPAVMLLKRSVSPDGRIDSLSVEFTAEVDGMVVKEVADRAARLLMLQSAIRQGFPYGAKNGNGAQPKPEQQNEASGAVLGRWRDHSAGMDSTWSDRLFIWRTRGRTAGTWLFAKELSLPTPSGPMSSACPTCCPCA